MNKKRACVIGSGFGGLGTAIRLQSSGIQTVLYEKREKAGGRAYVYQEKGFTFDMGPTVITAPHCLSELFEITNHKLEDYVKLKEVSPLYRLHWEDGFKFDYTEGLKETVDQIRKFSPEDADNYPKFLEYTRQVFDAGYTELAHVPFLNIWSMIKVSPELIKLEAYRSVYSIVSKFIKNEKLRQAFSFHSLLVGGNPFSASSIYTLIHYLERKWGVTYPEGGMQALVQSLVKFYQQLGGEIHFNSELDQICTSNGRVTGVKLQNGKEENFDLVVSNADVYHTYDKLLRKESRLDGKRWRLRHSSYSMSLFLIYFGVKKEYPGLAHHNVLFGNRYKGLLNDIFKKGVLADDFSIYLHCPTVSDSTMAPEGCSSFYALSPVPHLGKLDINWKVEGPKYAEKILEYIEKYNLPGLRENIVVQKIFTPEDFKTELNAHLGSAFSLQPLLTQSAYFRTPNRDPKISGLYFVGAGTHPGAGIPGVLNSAKATSNLILSDLKISVKEQISTDFSLDKHCKKSIQVGSKSFSLASKLFSDEMYQSATYLYSFCRYVDDAVDEIKDKQLQLEKVAQLKIDTEAAFTNQVLLKPEFTALQKTALKYGIPKVYALDLIEGMALDAKGQVILTESDLEKYCYHVAGVVGLMMSKVMGVSSEKAYSKACDLGIAMQLTNIARDVREDYEMQRIYLPLEWINEIGLCSGELLLSENKLKTKVLIKRLIEKAEPYYKRGISGLKYLPFRGALAVAAAIVVYRQIGRQVYQNTERSLAVRTVVSKPRKYLAIIQGFLLVMMTIPNRIFKPWKKVGMNSVWRYQ